MEEFKDKIYGFPTEEGLAQLPKWAVVAFAARCVLRVQPIFDEAWLRSSDKEIAHNQIKSFAYTLALVQEAAQSPVTAKNRTDSYADSYYPTDADEAAMNAAGEFAHAAIRAANAAFGAAHFAAIGTVQGMSVTEYVNHLSRTVGNVVKQARKAAPQAGLSRSMWHDYELLKAASVQENWSDDTPVPPEFFGPLWPEGEPEGWPEEGREKRAGDMTLTVEIDLPEDADDDDIEQAVLELVERMEDMHHAEGGRGIVIDAVEIPLTSNVPTGVC